MKIYWTPTAKATYLRIINYLEISWTSKEVNNFMDEVDSLLDQITLNPYMFEASRKKHNVRRGFVTKHTSLFYRVKPRKKVIELLVFWNNRKYPGDLSY